MNVAKLMTPHPIAVHAEDRLSTAARKMAEHGIRHLPVVDQDGLLVGLLSQRELLSAGDLGHHRVNSLMRKDVQAVSPETYAHEAAYLMLHHKIGCLPITDASGKLVGIITESDFVQVAYTLLGGTVPIAAREDEDEHAGRL